MSNDPIAKSSVPAISSGLEISASRHFTSWLEAERLSLAFSTYQAGKLFLIGLTQSGSLSGFERTFPRCMGMWSDGQTIWLSSLYQVWRLENSLLPGQVCEGYDRWYVPQVGYTTGDVDIHDLGVDANGEVVFVSTLFGCLARLSERCSLRPIWRPPFLSKIVPEDRCHLNGLAFRDGEPAYATACSQSDLVDGWRDHRMQGGVVLDVRGNSVVALGLSMPHSPRFYEQRLWLLDSGTGYLGWVDLDTGAFERLTLCPGYARGLAFWKGFALVGLSKCRQERTFAGLQLQAELRERGGEAMCGVVVVDLQAGAIVHWLRIDGAIDELYDVCVLPGVRRPRAVGFKTDEICRMVRIEDDQSAQRWVAQSSRPTE
jgi:uncharacterized protein (TIGR03032 family)